MAKSVHYYGLDLLRIAAAALVVADHFGAFGWQRQMWAARGADVAFPFLFRMENIGSIGVEIFFLISGFVIAASAKGASASQFAKSRAIRVLPALWICGLIAFAARASIGEPLVPLVAAYLRSAVVAPIGPYIDGVVWTLVVEAVFYVTIFLLLLGRSFDRLETLAKALGFVSAAFVAVYALAYALSPHDPRFATLAALCGRYPFKVIMLRHGVFFALGMMLWLSFEHGFTRARLAVAAALAVACSVEIGIDRGGPADVSIALALWWGGFAILVASVVCREAVAARLGPYGASIQNLGRLSYPLYLNHYTLGSVLVPAFFAAGLPSGLVLALSLAIVVATSWAIMRWPERGAQRVLRARLIGRPPVPRGDLQKSPALVGW